MGKRAWLSYEVYQAGDTIGGFHVVGYSDIDNLVELEKTLFITKTLYLRYTSTLSSTYTLTSTETHTLTEKAPLSYWHGWLPVLFFALAGVAGAAVFALSKTTKHKAPLMVLPPGACLICPSCGTANPLDVEYCMECGARLR